jgi:hypothetical protein
VAQLSSFLIIAEAARAVAADERNFLASTGWPSLSTASASS